MIEYKGGKEWMAAKPPLIVLSDNTFSFFGWAIRHAERRREHKSGYWQHAMVLYSIGNLASQEWLLRRRGVNEFLSGDHRLKAWYNPNWTERRMRAAIAVTEASLRLSWWKRRYDWLGVIGHAIGLPWLNLPHLRYCSEFTGEIFRLLEPDFGLAHPTPSQIDDWCKSHPQMKVCMRFDPDLESGPEEAVKSA